jgi:quercetin dioxygenase-like cupin family protein
MEHHPKSPTTKGSGEWFTGDVWIDHVAQGHGATPTTVRLMHFGPGARTAWHSHEVAQTLYVTEGEDRVQRGREPVATVRAGDVVVASGGEWHWHAAAPDHFMTHLAVSDGAAEWGEHVSDAGYQGENEQ